MSTSTSIIFPKTTTVTTGSSWPCTDLNASDWALHQLEWKIPTVDINDLIKSVNLNLLINESGIDELKALFWYFTQNIYNKAIETAEKISMLTLTKMNIYFNDILA